MRKSKVFMSVSAALIMIFSLSAVSFADTGKRFQIIDYNISVDLDGSGDASVEERITYRFDGQFNGVYLNIDAENTSGLEKPEISKLSEGQPVQFTEGDSGNPGTWQLTTEGNLYKFKVFEPSANEEKTFLLRYTLKDAVIQQTDIVEFNRKLVGKGWQETLRNVDIRIVIPEGAQTDQLKVFAHGPLTGSSAIVDSRTFEMKADMVQPGEFVEACVLFPLSLTPKAKTKGSSSLSKILEQEAAFAEEANRQREEARKAVEENNNNRADIYGIDSYSSIYMKFDYAVIILPLSLALWVLLFIYLYRKYDKELKSGFNAKYYRELPGEYTPAEMSILMNSGRVAPGDIMATLLDLSRKGILSFESFEYEEKHLFTKKEKQDYKITLKEIPQSIRLKSHESDLIDWFLNIIGTGREVLLSDIRAYSSDHCNGLEFKRRYDAWSAIVAKEAEANGFFDGSTSKGRLFGGLTGVFYLGLGVLLAVAMADFRYSVLVLAGVILMIYAATIQKRTGYGNDHFRMWEAFRRFLRDFSNLERAEIPSLAIWEHYLVYAVSLGVAKEVIRQLPLVFREEDFNDPSLLYFRAFYYSAQGHGFDAFDRMMDDSMNTMESSVSSAQSIASSQDSSSSGSSGGFSSGDSGGGGGNSGGGAF